MWYISYGGAVPDVKNRCVIPQPKGIVAGNCVPIVFPLLTVSYSPRKSIGFEGASVDRDVITRELRSGIDYTETRP